MFDFLNTTAMQDSNSRIPKAAETLASMYDSNVGNTSGRTDINNSRNGINSKDSDSCDSRESRKETTVSILYINCSTRDSWNSWGRQQQQGCQYWWKHQ
jgi:hypothetical protein